MPPTAPPPSGVKGLAGAAPARQAAREKAFAAEANVAVVRGLVILTNVLAYVFLLDHAGTVEWLAYTIVVVASAYGLFVLGWKPYQRIPVMLTAGFTTATDASLITAWVFATGAFDSPFYILWYVSIAAVAFRFDFRVTMAVCAVYTACYVGLLAAAGELLSNPTVVGIQSVYIFFVGALGGLLSREAYGQTEAKLQAQLAAGEAERGRREVRFLHELTERIAASRSIDDAFDVVLRRTSETTGWDWGAAWVRDRERGVLECTRIWSGPGEVLQQLAGLSRGRSLRLGEGLAGRVWQHRAPELVPDLRADPGFAWADAAAAAGLVSALAAPVLDGDEVIAVLVFLAGPDRAGIHDPESLRLATTAAAQLGPVIRRKAAESAVQLGAERLRAVVDTAQDGIVSTDGSGGILAFNHAAERMFGYKAAEVAGRPVAMLLSQGSGGPAGGPGRLRQGHVLDRRAELVGLRKDGTEFPLDVSSASYATDQGVFVTAILRDVSGTKRVMADLEHARDAAEAATRAKSEFLANMSHEIRTPLNAVLGMTGLMLSTELTTEQRSYAATVRESAEYLLTIINDLLDLSKVEAGRLQLDEQPFGLRGCIEGALDLLTPTAQSKRLGIGYELGPGVPEAIVGDPGRLRQVLVNLVGNGIKFTEKGRVFVRVAAATEGNDDLVLRFAVEDTGIGIAPEVQGQLFRPFQQGDSSITRAHGGTGLGLAISKRLVEAMGGRIWFETEPGAGTTFSFDIRAKRWGGPIATAAEPGRFDAGLGARQPLRILVAEDNRVNQLVAVRMLEKMGYRADVAADGSEVLQAFAREPYDVVLMDVQMPGMDGLEAARQLRKGPADGQPYIVALTAHAGSEDRQRCLASGMDDYVAKPFSQATLAGALTRAWTARGARR